MAEGRGGVVKLILAPGVLACSGLRILAPVILLFGQTVNQEAKRFSVFWVSYRRRFPTGSSMPPIP